VDEQADAHRLLAQVMPQLMLLDDALKSAEVFELPKQ
jgi:hypothetical protein